MESRSQRLFRPRVINGSVLPSSLRLTGIISEVLKHLLHQWTQIMKENIVLWQGEQAVNSALQE